MSKVAVGQIWIADDYVEYDEEITLTKGGRWRILREISPGYFQIRAENDNMTLIAAEGWITLYASKQD